VQSPLSELPPVDSVVRQIILILEDPQKSHREKFEACVGILKEHTAQNRALDPSDESRHNVWNYPGIYLMRIGEFDLARSLYDEMRKVLLFRQAHDGRRYHKGTAYHNLGVALLGLGQLQEARSNITIAFIEDVLSFPDPTGAPAYTALRQIFAVSNDFLRELAEFAMKSNVEDKLDPESLYSKFMSLEAYARYPTYPLPLHPLRAYEQRIFQPNKDLLKDLLQRVEQAQTNMEKKATLENLSEELFGSVEGFEVLPSRRTVTGELDRIIRNEHTSHPFLLGLGSHILVECKNWFKKVGAGHIRIFLDKMDEHRCKAGVILAKNGISGKGVREAIGRIRSKYQQNGIITIVLSKDDLKKVINCENLIQIMKEKAEDVKFPRR